MEIKRCPKCKKIKFINEFSKNKSRKDKHDGWCKNCTSIKFKKYRKNNKLKIRESNKKWRENNSEKDKERKRNWAKNNPEKVKGIRRRWQKNNGYSKKYYNYNSTKAKKYRVKFYSIPKNRLSKRISYLMWKSLKGDKNGRCWENLVGYSLEDLITHFEKLFKPNMGWNNIVKWHIDHVRPVSSFNFNSYNDPEFKECWALENLRPLWAEENWSKGNRMI